MVLHFMKLKDGLSPEQHGREIRLRTLTHDSYRICLTNSLLTTVANNSVVLVMCPGLFQTLHIYLWKQLFA